MKEKRLLIFCGIFVFLILSLAGCSKSDDATTTSTTYSTSDLNGTWSSHQLIAADSPTFLGWYYGDVTFNNGSMTQSNGYFSDGPCTSYPSQTVTLSSDGIMAPSGSDLNGILSNAKNVFVETHTEDGGAASMSIMLIKSGTFSTSDLEGTWYMHYLMVGDGTNANDWVHATASISSAGEAVVTKTGRAGGSLDPNPFTEHLVVASNGAVTSSDTLSLHGQISSDKNLLVFTIDDGKAGSYGLAVFVKAGTTFSQSDLTGNWIMHALMAIDGGNRWAHGNATFDSSGNLSYSNITTSDSSTLTDVGQAVVASTGIVTFAGISDVHGVLSADKNLLIIVGNTNSGTERTMLIFVKR
jgi:hypothetical protein